MIEVGYLIFLLMFVLGMTAVAKGIQTLRSTRSRLLRALAILAVGIGLVLIYPMLLVAIDRMGFDVKRWPLGSPETSRWIIGS